MMAVCVQSQTVTQILTPDELLTTTRAIRHKLDLNRSVDMAIIRECIEIALHAPSGSNVQDWHWVVITHPDTRAAIADLYRDAFEQYRQWPSAAGNIVTGEPGRDATQERVMRSAEYLAANLHRVPVLVIPCIEANLDRQPAFTAASKMGSIAPAAWSFCLAARARQLGTSWTTLHLLHAQAVAELIGIPKEVSQAALIPVAHVQGDPFRRASREPVDAILHVDCW